VLASVASTHAQSIRPLTAAERKVVDELLVEQKRLDADSAHMMAATPDGRRRVTETIAKHFKVQEPIVNRLRARKITYGEVGVALALSRELMKRDAKLTQQQAAEKVVSLRKSGESWGGVARESGVKLDPVVGEIKRLDALFPRADKKPVR
jgi:hypothetical protein